MAELSELVWLFDRERARLVEALGAITVGGVVERVEWIGSSSISGLEGSGDIDIGLAVWPFPADQSKLVGLGYQPAGSETEDLQRFELEGQRVQLWLAKADSGFLEQAVLLRDYLRNHETARQDFVIHRAEKNAFFQRILPDAQRWWVEYYGFTPLKAVTAEFTGGPQPVGFDWYISSGWAIDLFLGRVTRVHRDVDVVVPFSQQAALQEHLLSRGWELLTSLDGRLEQWPRHMQIELPRHQVHAHRGGDFIDFLFTEIKHGIWRYRRDPAILRNVERMALTSPDGIPYLAPEIVLLFKSKNTGKRERPQDQDDFEQVLGLLEPERRAWLRWAVTASDPGHPWLGLL